MKPWSQRRSRMEEKQSKKGFLQSLFGFGKADPEPVKSPLEAQSPITDNPQVPIAQAPARTEAYQNRKKGRKQHSDRIQDLKRIIDYIQSRGEVTAGELTRELGMSRSTLTYNLKWL